MESMGTWGRGFVVRSGHVKVALTRFADGLDVRDETRGTQEDSESLGLDDWKPRWP